MPKVKLTITDSRCRSGYLKKVRNILSKIYVLHYAMNYGITSIRLFMLCRMELSWTTAISVPKCSMPNARMKAEWAFMEKSWKIDNFQLNTDTTGHLGKS